MQFSIETSSPFNPKGGRAATIAPTDCVIVPVYAQRKLGPAGQAVDALLGGALIAALARHDIAEALNSVLIVPGNDQVARVLLIAAAKAESADPAGQSAAAQTPRRRGKAASVTGPELHRIAEGAVIAPVSERAFSELSRAAFRAANTTGAKKLLSLLAEVPVGVERARPLAWNLQAQVLSAHDATYRFDRLRSTTEPRHEVGAIALAVPPADATAATLALRRAQATAMGVTLARDLGNLPGNYCTPTVLANEAKALAKRHGLKVQVLERKQMQALQMGSLLAVAQGSDEPPKLIVLEWRGGGRSEAPIALVGKGVTFDSGGISLKGGEGMDEMKFDMSGAGAVLGTLAAIASMQLPINVVGVIPATENMPSGRAVKPGDVVTSMSGKTIEILNTDAEGRLILCDALTYVARFEPSAVIDLATLTGACVIALGHHHSGLFANTDGLAADLLAAGRDTLDTCWRMPLDDEYQEQLKSPFADMANIGGRPAGSVTAACFLARFAKGYQWAHLDIAGTAWKSGAAKGSTGRPVPMLTQFLVERADRNSTPAHAAKSPATAAKRGPKPPSRGPVRAPRDGA